jgi:hypothetical protein
MVIFSAGGGGVELSAEGGVELEAEDGAVELEAEDGAVELAADDGPVELVPEGVPVEPEPHAASTRETRVMATSVHLSITVSLPWEWRLEVVSKRFDDRLRRRKGRCQEQANGLDARARGTCPLATMCLGTPCEAPGAGTRWVVTAV